LLRVSILWFQAALRQIPAMKNLKAKLRAAAGGSRRNGSANV